MAKRTIARRHIDITKKIRREQRRFRSAILPKNWTPTENEAGNLVFRNRRTGETYTLTPDSIEPDTTTP